MESESFSVLGTFVGSLKIFLALSALNLLAAASLLLVLSRPLLDSVSLLALVEAAILFLVGGGMDLTSSVFFGKVREHVFHSEEGWDHRRQVERQRRASKYVVAGALMLLKCLSLAITL